MEPPRPPTPAVDRYARQARLRVIGPEGQARIRAGRVVVIGCGALGSAAVDLLARAGVGDLVVVDRDVVELSNLQRQVLFDEADAAAGAPKAAAAAEKVGRINGDVRVHPHVVDVTSANVEALLAGAQVVVDGTDNMETRYLLNDACVKLGIPWVYGGAVGTTGVAMPIVPGDTPCFRCLFPASPSASELGTCEMVGVLGGLVTLVAAVQWTEAVKLLTGDRASLLRGLATFDLWGGEYQVARGLARHPDCPCCALRRFDWLETRATSLASTLCGRDAVQVSPATPVQLDLAALGARLAGVGTVTTSPFLVRIRLEERELTVFADGRAIVKGTSDLGVARSLYARWVGA
jgi:molybdopterin/thiamine biosynthesis adenylyltransferase